MINYTSQKQLEIFDFRLGFEGKLDINNRWVKLSKLLDWDALAKIYSRTLNADKGAKGIDARVVIGALIIKHIEVKDDRGTIEMICENPYMQFFLGYDSFHFDAVFDPSLFVHIRKRLGNAEFDQMNQLIIQQALMTDVKDSGKKEDGPPSEENKPPLKPNKGKLQMDATIADSHIKYPTDIDLLDQAREKTEELITSLCKREGKAKPRTYKMEARKNYLNIAKKKKKTKMQIRKVIRKQLGYLSRNISYLDKLFDGNKLLLSSLSKTDYKYLLVVQELHRQQREMYDAKVNTVDNRIVSIHQPHVRPMVRGKEARKVEFGAKINVSLEQGYTRINQISFDAFNEGKYLKEQVESYKSLHGHYPELVQTDDIYMTRENRGYLKENNIRHTGRPLGRKPKTKIAMTDKKQHQEEKNERNWIEGKFGQGKNRYGLNKIMARLSQTSESWIASILFVMNILKMSKDIFCLFLKNVFYHLFNPKSNHYFHINNSAS
ncbi:IS5 family transposase [Microcoleus sp. herbarium8]